MRRLKKPVSLLLALLFCWGMISFSPGITAYAASPEIIGNGSFDSSLDGWNIRWSGQNKEFVHDDQFGHSKNGSAKAVPAGEANNGLYLVDVPVEAGAQYTLSYWGYKTTDSPAYLDVGENGGEGNVSSGGIEKKNEWVNISFDFTPTASKVVIRCVVASLTSGNAWFDDISLKKAEASEVIGKNVLENGDFEDTDMSKWWNRQDWNGGNWVRTDGVGFGGTVGLAAESKVDSPDGSYNIGMFYTLQEGNEATLTLEAGKVYELSAKFFRAAGVDSYLYMDVNEGALGNIAATKNGEWEEVKTRFEAPSTPIKLRLVCNALAKGEKVYVDDIKLAQVNSSLDRVDGVPDRSLAINGSMENGQNTIADDWNQTSVWKRTAEENGVKPVNGEYMMKAEATATAICIGSAITVKPNTYYTYSGWLYRTDNKGTAYFNILDENKRDIAGTQIGTDSVGEWVRSSYTFYSGDHTKVYPRMVVDGTADAAPSGAPIYFDDVMFVEQVWEDNKAFPEGVDLTEIIKTYTLGTDTTKADFAVYVDGLYMTSLEFADESKNVTQYIDKAIKVPLISVINGENVEWIYESSGLVATDNKKILTASFVSADGKYAIDAIWTAGEGVGPLEYNQRVTSREGKLSIAYPDVVSANFRIEPDSDATLYRFSRSRVNDGSDPYFAEGTLKTPMAPGVNVISSVENGYSPVASILPYQVIDIGGSHGVYFGHYWSFGKLLVRNNDRGSIAITTYLSDNEDSKIEREEGVTLDVPGFFIGTYNGDIDNGSNDMKHWFWKYKITRTLYENDDEPLIEADLAALTSEQYERLFRLFPDIANYINVLKIDYIWTLPSGLNPRVDKETEDKWLPDPTRYPNGMNVWSTIKNFAKNDGIDKDLYLSLYMSDTYLGKDIGTVEGREAQLAALKERMNPNNNNYGVGYDYWRSDFMVEKSYDYDSHEGLLYILDEMIDYSEDFRYEHCSGAGSLKDFTTLERMTFMTTEDTARPLNHRMSLYANTYMISPVQLKGDLNMTYNDRDFGGITGGPIIGYDENGKLIDVWTVPEYVKYTMRTGMLGSSMVCFDYNGLEANLDIVKEHHDLYNNKQRAILRDCNVYHILDAPTGWGWNDWDGIEYYNDNIDKGVIMLFKENKSAPDDKVIKLKGLEPKRKYSLSFTDRTEQNCVLTGEELMNNGINVTGMTEQYDSEMIYIEPFAEPGMITGITFSDKTFEYDGTEKSIFVEGALQGDVVAYENNGKVNVGTHIVTATIRREGYTPLVLTAKLIITEKKNNTESGDKTVTPGNKTGDDNSVSMIYIYLAAAAAAIAAGAVTCVVLIKRKKHGEK